MPTLTGSENLFTEVPIAENGTFSAVFRYFLKGEPREFRDNAQPVLLLHAATLGRKMFIEPNGGFVKYLLDLETDGAPRYDVFTLDWRSSNQLFGNWGEGGEGFTFDDYRVDRVAFDDVPAGVGAVAKVRKGRPLRIVAHCIGGTATAQALAAGKIGGLGDPPIDHIVLSTLGLFYRQGIDGALKTSENIMRDLESSFPKEIGVSPHVAFDKSGLRWNALLEPMYQTWAGTVFPHPCNLEFCKRIWFLYGGDYRSTDMEAMHTREILGRHFGALPVGLCRQLIENCQRGWAAPFSSRNNREYLRADPFAGRSITLITGSENQVWHRDSIDSMYEWLGRSLRGRAQRIEKRVFDDYGHVDLWWSTKAPKDVFSYVERRLRETPSAAT
jgi:Alpha/beta hydrolase family